MLPAETEDEGLGGGGGAEKSVAILEAYSVTSPIALAHVP